MCVVFVDAVCMVHPTTAIRKDRDAHSTIFPSQVKHLPHLPSKPTMKFAVVAAAAALAVVNAGPCDITKTTALFTNIDFTQCAIDSGYAFVPLTVPSADTIAKMCNSTSCQGAIVALKGLNLGDCTLFGVHLDSEVINPIESMCGNGSSVSANGTAGSAAQGSAGSAPNGTAGSSSPGAATNESPAPAAPGASSEPAMSPTPAPTTSAASSIALATGAIAAAVAAAIF